MHKLQLRHVYGECQTRLLV